MAAVDAGRDGAGKHGRMMAVGLSIPSDINHVCQEIAASTARPLNKG
jgi:hypothetical protein